MQNNIVFQLQSGKSVFIVAHGNSLRALVKFLDNIDDSKISKLNIPTGIPLIYELDKNLQPVKPGGYYLDPQAAKSGIENVVNQGK